MTVQELIQKGKFKLLNEGNNLDKEIRQPYCCDLLSIAMGRMPAASGWITVMGNVNTLAVASLTEAACIILAEDSAFDDMALKKSKEQGITVFATNMTIFDAALSLHEMLHE